MPDYEIDGKSNRVIVNVDEDGTVSGVEDGGTSGKKGKVVTYVAVGLALAALITFVALSRESAELEDAEQTVAESDDAATGTGGVDEEPDGSAGDGLTDEEVDELVAILDGIGGPIFTIDDIPPDVSTPDGAVTLFGAMDAALREVNTDPNAQPYYPVAWGSMDAMEDGSAGSWYFSMVQAGQTDLSVQQVDVSGDGIVSLADVVHGPDYGFSGQEMFGSYPPGGMDSPDLWAASPHPTTCSTWQNRGLSYYYDDEHGMPVVIFAGNDPSCFPDGPLWLHIDPVTGIELDVPGP